MNDEKPNYCDFCGFPTANLKSYRSNRGFGQIPPDERPVMWLCDLCARTPAGTAHEYPEQCGRENRDVLKTICYVGNTIMASLGKPI